MADTKLSDLSAGAATSATDLFYVVQSAGSGGVKGTAAQLKTFTSASPTLVTPALGVATATSIAIGGATLGANALAITGHVLVEGVASTGATGTGKFVFDASPTISGHITVEGVTATGATGTGKFVFDGSPTLVTPIIGVATATSINKVTLTAPATSATLTIADGKTLTVSNSITIAGTDSTVMTFPTTSATVARTDAANTFTGHQTIEGVTSTGATGTGKFVFDGTPTLVTPVLGVATATSVTANAFIANSSNVNAQTTTSYTLASTDNGKVVTFNTSSAVTTTYTSSLGAGFACTLVQLGAGQVTVTSSGTTLNARVGKKLVGQYSVASLYAYIADTAILGGDLSA